MTMTLAVSVALAASPAPTPAAATNTASGSSPTAPGDDDTDPPAAAPAGPAPQHDTAEEGPMPAGEADRQPLTTLRPPVVEDMSGHDHGDLSVSILVDENRFHVSGTVRPGQSVTVYNSSDSAATITALDGSFDADAPARTFITFAAPTDEGGYEFVSRAKGSADTGFADILLVRADP
jgi:hypothetical protein